VSDLKIEARQMIERSIHIPLFDELYNSPYIIYGDEHDEENQDLKCVFCKKKMSATCLETEPPQWILRCDCKEADKCCEALTSLSVLKQDFDMKLDAYLCEIKKAGWEQAQDIAICLLNDDLINLEKMKKEKLQFQHIVSQTKPNRE